MNLILKTAQTLLAAPTRTLAVFIFGAAGFPALGQTDLPLLDTNHPLPLSMEQSVQMALTNNLDILIAQINPVVDQFSINSVYAAYDPSLSFSMDRSFSTSGGSQFFPGFIIPANTTASDSYQPALSGMLPWGMNYSLSTPLSQQTTPDKNYSSSPSISLSQPILKNSWIDSPRLQLQLSRKTLRGDQLALRLQIQSTIYNVKAAYYNLIAARQNVEVQRAAMQLAQKLADENTRKVQLGAMAPLDQRQAESQVASSQADMLSAELSQATAENTLKALLSSNLEEWRDRTLVPTDELLAVPETPDISECLQHALENRPEMLQAKLAIEKQNLTIKYNRNQLYPELDLKTSYGINAFAQNFDATMDILRQGTDQSYSFGLALTVPLENTAARNSYKSSKASLEQLLLQLKKIENTIVTAVDNDVKSVRADLLRVSATRKASEYAQDALTAGQARLTAGSTTSFEVLQLQNNLTSARSAEIRAVADYNLALEQLALDEGTTLERNHIDLKLP